MKKRFQLKINGKETIHIEVEGSKEIIDAFVKNVFTDSFGIFYKLKDEFAKIFLNGIQVRMSTIFRRLNSQIVSPKEIVKEAKNLSFPNNS